MLRLLSDCVPSNKSVPSHGQSIYRKREIHGHRLGIRSDSGSTVAQGKIVTRMRGRPAHSGRSRDLRAVIPAQVGIQAFWERGRPARAPRASCLTRAIASATKSEKVVNATSWRGVNRSLHFVMP